MFNSIQVTNYWFTLHRALGPLYQQAQTSSPNIQGISDQNITTGRLIKRLNKLPLTLATAEMYISQTADSFNDYLQMYEES